MKQKFYSSILFAAILITISSKTFSQGVGNHITMSLENCSMPALNIIQFDLDVTSDGVSTSDLRMGSCSYGINFDTCILQSGATDSVSYVPGSTDSIFPSPVISILHSSFPNHIRLTQGAVTNNSGVSMIIGRKYRFGTFRLISSANYTSYCPNFNLQDVSAGGKTNTVGIVFIGASAVATAFNVTGTGDGFRSVNAICTNCSCTTGIDENNANPLISFYPNPVENKLTVGNWQSRYNRDCQLKIYNLLGEVKYSEMVKEQQTTIDLSKLSNGIYILEATMENAVGRYKFIVNHNATN